MDVKRNRLLEDLFFSFSYLTLTDLLKLLRYAERLIDKRRLTAEI